MLTELCQYLRNWFDRKPDGALYPRKSGTFTIENGELIADFLANGQYFRIMGSLFNDGVHKHGEADLTDETFCGDVWSMGVPPAVVALADDIKEWQGKYGKVDDPAMSPYQSESFGGYSYQKGSASSGSGNGATWQTVFAARLTPWRKL